MKTTTFCGLLSVRLFLAASATLCAAPAQNDSAPSLVAQVVVNEALTHFGCMDPVQCG